MRELGKAGVAPNADAGVACRAGVSLANVIPNHERASIRSGCSFRAGRPTLRCSVCSSRSSSRRVICDRVATKVMCRCSGRCFEWAVAGARAHIVKGKWTMKAGVVYPQIELGGDTGAVKAFAQAAEELGYDHIVIYDHVLGAVHAGREPKLTGPYKENDPFHEPLVTYAYLAGVTKNLGLATGVIILPQRQTALFAKQAADVDLFSDGRLRLGVGVGWNGVVNDALETSRHCRRRGKRQEHWLAMTHKPLEQPMV